MLNYTRVIPRDFFNEAKLLKCMGLLSLKILDRMLPDGIEIEVEENGAPFQINLSDAGDLIVTNYKIIINGDDGIFYTIYNSKENYPFFCYCANDNNDVRVFNEAGVFTEEFVQKFQKLKTEIK